MPLKACPANKCVCLKCGCKEFICSTPDKDGMSELTCQECGMVQDRKNYGIYYAIPRSEKDWRKEIIYGQNVL